MTRERVRRAPSTGWDAVLETGTRLRVTRIEEPWDNTHAMIIRGYRFTLHLRVLDGPSRGQLMDLKVDGSVIDQVGEEFEGITLPGWLEVALSATPGLKQEEKH
jgi:hypothetical protein